MNSHLDPAEVVENFWWCRLSQADAVRWFQVGSWDYIQRLGLSPFISNHLSGISTRNTVTLLWKRWAQHRRRFISSRTSVLTFSLVIDRGACKCGDNLIRLLRRSPKQAPNQKWLEGSLRIGCSTISPRAESLSQKPRLIGPTFKNPRAQLPISCSPHAESPVLNVLVPSSSRFNQHCSMS